MNSPTTTPSGLIEGPGNHHKILSSRVCRTLLNPRSCEFDTKSVNVEDHLFLRLKQQELSFLGYGPKVCYLIFVELSLFYGHPISHLAQFSKQGGGYQMACVFIWGCYKEITITLQRSNMSTGLLVLAQVFMECLIKDGR